MEDLHKRLAEKQVLPHHHLVDTGYVDAENMAKSQQDHHIDLVGPALAFYFVVIKRSRTL